MTKTIPCLKHRIEELSVLIDDCYIQANSAPTKEISSAWYGVVAFLEDAREYIAYVTSLQEDYDRAKEQAHENTAHE